MTLTIAILCSMFGSEGSKLKLNYLLSNQSYQINRSKSVVPIDCSKIDLIFLPVLNFNLMKPAWVLYDLNLSRVSFGPAVTGTVVSITCTVSCTATFLPNLALIFELEI